MKRLSKNLLAIVGSDVGRRVLGFLTVAYLARKIGTASFGAMNIGFTVLSYGLMISGMGLPIVGARAMARGDSPDIVGRIVGIRIAGAILVYGVVVATAFLTIQNSISANLIALYCLSILVNPFVIEWYFQGKEQMGFIGVSRLMSAGVYLLLILLLVQSSADIYWVAIASVIGDVLSAGILITVFRYRTDEALHIGAEGWRPLLAQAIPVGSGSILAGMSANLPILVIGIMLTNVEAGIFSAASKLVMFLLVMDRVLGTLLLPASSRLQARSPESLSAALSLALRWIVLLALPICVGGMLLADRIIPLVYGSQYVSAIDVFRVLIWFFFANMIHTIYTNGLIAIGQERSYGRYMLVTVILYLVFVALGTRMYGIIGASVAVVMSEISSVILLKNRFSKFARIHIHRSTIIIIPAVVAMAAVVLLLPPVHIFVSILIGAVVYFGLLLLTRGLTIGEINALMERIA